MLFVAAVALDFFRFKDAMELVGACFAYCEGAFPGLIIGETAVVWIRVFVFLGKNPAPVLLWALYVSICYFCGSDPSNVIFCYYLSKDFCINPGYPTSAP
jgi:hypothetical protein